MTEPSRASAFADQAVVITGVGAAGQAGETVAQFLARRTGVAAAQTRYDAATAAYDEDPDEYAEALDHWLALGGAAGGLALRARNRQRRRPNSSSYFSGVS